MRKFLLLASIFITLAGATTLPAGAATPVTFTLTAGALAISAPTGSVALGASQVASTSSHTFSGRRSRRRNFLGDVCDCDGVHSR